MIVAVLVASGASAMITWWFAGREDAVTPTTEVAAPLPITRAEAKTAKARVPAKTKKPITVLPPSVKEALTLPEPVRKNPESQVLATGRIQAEERPYSLSAVLDGGTGMTTIYAKAEPLPWLALERKAAAGFAYGVRDDGARVGLLHGRVDVLQVKRAHLGAMWFVDTDGRAYAGLNVEVRF